MKNKYDAIILHTKFSLDNYLENNTIDENNVFFNDCKSLINKAYDLLNDGGLLFIYGLPNYLPFLGEYLNNYNSRESSFIFKYWIACEFKNDFDIKEGFPTAHIGLLMYLKSKNTKTPTPFNLNTKFVRIPYTSCPSCGKNTKDWGGKQHMLNPLGTALSDVWSFYPLSIKTSNSAPKDLIDRIRALLGNEKNILLINQEKEYIPNNITQPIIQNTATDRIETNRIIHGSCTEYLKRLKRENPNGIFNLAFADPPYNLSKNYSKYDDALADKEYISWCNEWLEGMYENLKPGGALLVLNIPKWAISHFSFLSKKMIFKNWIVWDALSTPSGKLLPAHYSLLYFIKPGGTPTVNLKSDNNITDRLYCLRDSCIKKRIKKDIVQEELFDIWHDIYRIKHKKDRDHHPCQLPTKLMERIIRIFSNEDDLVFDPFGGAGTTAIAAKLLNRDYIITEIDEKYVEIAHKNLNKIELNSDGELVYERTSVQKEAISTIPKKIVEKEYMDLCFMHKKVFTLEETNILSQKVYDLLLSYTGNFKKLQNLVKRKMEATLF
ncbi:MAG: DNA-methyltransferase [Dysgonomonas sp.]